MIGNQKGGEVMEVQRGRKLAIIGAVFLIYSTLVELLYTAILTLYKNPLSLGESKIFAIISILSFLKGLLVLIIGWLLILIGLKYITEKINEQYLYKILLLAFITCIIVFIMVILPLPTILSYIPFFILQGILIPILFFKLGNLFNSIILKISGVFLFISTILSLLAEYLLTILQPSNLLNIISQCIAAIVSILILLGFILLKIPVLTEQKVQAEMQSQEEQNTTLLRRSRLGIKSFIISKPGIVSFIISIFVPMFYLLIMGIEDFLGKPLLVERILVFVFPILNIVGFILGITGMVKKTNKTIFSMLGLIINGISLWITTSLALLSIFPL